MLGTVKWLISSFIVLMTLLPATVMAERSKVIGDYVVHYNALSTDMLDPTVARQYAIKRSKNRAMLNVSVLKKNNTMMGKAVNAKVKVTANNLTGQLRNIKTRQITEGEAIYYIGDFYVVNKESLDFKISVQPEEQGATYDVEFRQQFFTR